jgi:predicted alpha/beta-fold hydrolase
VMLHGLEGSGEAGYIRSLSGVDRKSVCRERV